MDKEYFTKAEAKIKQAENQRKLGI
jgi:hypothetical protein